VEVHFDGKIYCLRSTVPDMDLERKHKDASTAQALYDAIPMIAPTETQYVFCLDAEKGHYRLYSEAFYMALPLLSWTDILTFSNA
jgi:hypothetical protein